MQIKRSKGSILGLDADLNNLNIAISNEIANREQDVSNLTTSINNMQSSIENGDSNLQSSLDSLTDTVNDNKTNLESSINTVQSNLNTEITNRTNEISRLEGIINNIINNSDADAIDSLSEILTAFQNADSDLNNAIQQLASDRAAALSSAVETLNNKDTDLENAINSEINTRQTEDAKLLPKADNLASLTDKVASRNNLDVYSKTDTDTKIAQGGAIPKTEVLTVSSDAITLTYAPKSGMILNFYTVRNIDDNGVASDIPVTIDGNDNKKLNLHPDNSGDFDDKDVTVQYFYVPSV